MDSFFSFLRSLVISTVVPTTGYLASHSTTRRVKAIIYVAYVFCITALATSVHVWLSESDFLTIFLLNAIAIGAMSVVEFFFLDILRSVS